MRAETKGVTCATTTATATATAAAGIITTACGRRRGIH
jgi:hypothetical protein